MKKFEEPKLNVEMLVVEDVVATSTCPTFNPDCATQLSCLTD